MVIQNSLKLIRRISSSKKVGDKVCTLSPIDIESTDKPGSVMDSHSSGLCVTAYLKQPTREPCGSQAGLHPTPLFGLAPNGVSLATFVTKSAVRSYRTISPLLFQRTAVYFLLHFPLAFATQTLSGVLPYGARTFLIWQVINQ